jgi:cell wall-associated NlpC family hydrolase
VVFLLLAVAAAGLASVPAFAGPIESKRAQAQQVLNEIHALDVQLEKAIESYDAANIKLAQVRHELRVNRYEVRVARHNLSVAQQRLGAHVRDLYLEGNESSTLELILGAKNLDDLLNRIDTVNRVSDQDTQVLREVHSFRREVQHRNAVLRQANAEQQRVVAERAATKRQIEAGLGERQRMLSSIKGEIARLQAEERHRQALLAVQAQARLSQIREQQRTQLDGSILGAAAVTPDGPSVLPPAQYGGVVGIAMQYLGIPYVWGGSSPGGFDCSGFVMYVFGQMGVSLPHNAAAQYAYGIYVPEDQLEPGDLVFFDGLGHVGIYIGGGQFIHSPHTGDVVKISSLSDPWYAATYVGAKRIT